MHSLFLALRGIVCLPMCFLTAALWWSLPSQHPWRRDRRWPFDPIEWANGATSYSVLLSVIAWIGVAFILIGIL
jgi:hypothetical protein